MGVYNVSGENLMDTAFDVAGTLLAEAYDLDKNPLFDNGLQIVPNQATGAPSGKTFLMDSPALTYPAYEVVDFMQDSFAYQSFGYDTDRNVFYKFDGSTTVRVYNSNFQKTGTITLPESAGHTGDNCYYDGKFYFPGDIFSDDIYVWDVEHNTIELIPVYGVPEPTVAPDRVSGGICNVPNEAGFLYIVYADRQTNATEHVLGEELLVCKYEIATHTAEVVASYDWDCVYLQGCAISNGVLYATCNSPTTGQPSNYTGITLKAFRTDDWSELPSLHAYGAFEPEGMTNYPYGDVPQLITGIAQTQVMSMTTRLSVPYRLVETE